MAIYRGDGGAGDADNDVTVTTVTQKALEADNSASEAAASAVQSANSASAASTSASNAATSETNAANSATSASTSATNAATSATSASTSASNAASSASAASTSETNAASSASAASTSASNAATSETNAATSESNAASSASAASTSASNAATSASAASTSATNAATSATNAATSESNAATSASNAASSYDSFDDRYLGAKASDPTLDNDGDALITGALYFDTTNDAMKVYDGTSWLTAYVSLGGALLSANNLSDLNDAATARTNLGLGTAATTASTDYATAAQGTLADSAVQPADNVSTLTNDAGYLTGNQTITLSGDATGSGTTAITVTVADDSHNHIISNVDGLQTALDAKGTLSNVVEDTTPQLGGNLDTNSNDINFGDNDKAVFGAGSDLQIYHTGTASVIRDQGVGSLYIDGASEIFLRGQSGFTNMVKAIDGAEVELYHNNNLKLETTATGVDVTGTVNATAFSGDGSSLTGIEAFASGTAMLFAQTAAPTGWTKSTTHDNKALRVVSGTAGSGGNAGFTTAFASYTPSGNVSVAGSVAMSGNIVVGNTTLSVNTIPSHSHSYSRSAGNTNTLSNANGGGNTVKNNSVTGNQGNNGAHNHNANHNLLGNLTINSSSFTGDAQDLAVQYVDVIIATKD